MVFEKGPLAEARRKTTKVPLGRSRAVKGAALGELQ